MREEEKKLARDSQRDPMNEATLIWALLGGAISVGLILFDPILLYTGLGLPQWTALGFSISGVLALIWYIRARKTVQKAMQGYNEIMKAKKQEMRAAHLEKLKQRNK